MDNVNPKGDPCVIHMGKAGGASHCSAFMTLGLPDVRESFCWEFDVPLLKIDSMHQRCKACIDRFGEKMELKTKVGE